MFVERLSVGHWAWLVGGGLHQTRRFGGQLFKGVGGRGAVVGGKRDLRCSRSRRSVTKKYFVCVV